MSRKRTEFTKEEQKGEYVVRYCVDGTHRVLGRGLGKYGLQVLSLEAIRERYERDFEETGKMSGTVVNWLAYLGVIYDGKPSLVSGKKFLGIPIRETFPVSVFQDKIKSFWKKEDLERALQGEHVQLPTIIDFQKKYKQEYKAAKGRGGFRRDLEGMEYPYGNSYFLLRKQRLSPGINPRRLGKKLYGWFCTGRTVSPSILRAYPAGSEERRVYNQLATLGRGKGLAGMKKKAPVSRVIKMLTGLKSEDVKLGKSAIKKSSLLSEKLVSFLFNWAPIVGVEVNGWKGEITDISDRLCFGYNGGVGYADLRIGNSAVEVKSFASSFGNLSEEAIDRYKPGANSWQDGRLMDKSLFVFMQKTPDYDAVKQRLAEQGIDIMSAKEFRGYFHSVLTRLKKNHVAEVRGLQPRVNFDYLERLVQEVLTPGVLIRNGNSSRMDWSLEMLRGLIVRARQIRKGIPPAEEEVHLAIPGQRVERHSYGDFLCVERTFEDILEECGSMGRYIQEHMDRLDSSNLRKVFGDVAKKRILAFDIESCGLAYKDPLVGIGFSRFLEGRTLEPCVFFARDFSEERAMLYSFSKMIGEYDIFITYNGDAFDIPRLDERARQNGIVFDSGHRSLKEVLNGRHIDLYPVAKRNLKFRDRKLTTLERLLFGFERENDIAGRDIPRAYKEYVFFGKDGERLRKIIEHNLVDSVSLIALLARFANKI